MFMGRLAFVAMFHHLDLNARDPLSASFFEIQKPHFPDFISFALIV
jgi:hypothetical protein